METKREGRRFNISKYAMLFVLFAVLIMFGILRPAFWGIENLLNVISNACLFGIVGIGLTLITAAGEIDFCAASEFTIAATIQCILVTNVGMRNYYLVTLITIMSLLLIGYINAVLHVYCRIPSFIATLGTSYLIAGISKWMCEGLLLFGVSGSIGPIFTVLGQGYLFNFLPVPALILIILAVIMLFYTEKTKSGKYIYAVGVNSVACAYLGINVKRQKIKGFMLCSFCCAIAGIVQSSMLNGCSQEMGANMLTYGMTVLMLGACFLKLGVFNVPGTIVGSLIIATIANGMTLMGTSVASKEIVLGGILLLATTATILLKKRNSRIRV